MFQRTIVKMYKKNCCCDFLPCSDNLIATTPEDIEAQIAKFNAVKDSTIDFVAFPENEFNTDMDIDDDDEVYVSKAYSTNEIGDCPEKVTYCLLR